MKKKIHVNQHVIRSNKKNNENNPVITVKTYKDNVYGNEVQILGESTVVYRPNKPLSCGAKVWIETRGDIVLDKSSDTKDLSPTKLIASPTSQLVKKIDVEMGIFLRKKQRKIQNKNKLSACLSS